MSPNVAAATALLEAMKDKNLSHAPLAEKVSYTSPLTGETIRGREHVTRFLAVYLPIINDLHVIRHIADDDDYVATVLKAETSFGPLSIVYVLHVEAGNIIDIEGFYDPRGFLERMGRWTVASESGFGCTR
jgi:hypothetical protein